MRSVAAAAAAAYAALAGLVAAGSVNGIDQWAIDNAMPGGKGAGPAPSLLDAVVPLQHADFGTPLLAATQIVTLPGQVVVSLLLLGVTCLVLLRQRRIDAALAWAGAWGLGTAIELLCKHEVVRPRLYRHGLHIGAFDSSWPSGHTIRSALVAAALAAAWPRARAAIALWLVALLVLLELAGVHTPSDIVGGILLAVPLAAAAWAVERSGLLRRGAARARRPARPGPAPGRR